MNEEDAMSEAAVSVDGLRQGCARDRSLWLISLPLFGCRWWLGWSFLAVQNDHPFHGVRVWRAVG